MAIIYSEPKTEGSVEKQLHVLLLGPSLEQNGGMAAVQNLILSRTLFSFSFEHICTHDEGSLAHRGRIFAKALASFVQKLWFRRVDLVHIHVSERGSVLRKTLLILLAFAFRQPVLIHTHGAEFQPFFLKLPILGKRILIRIFRQCDGFIVLSESWQNFYISQLCLKPERVFILPNAVELPPQVFPRMISTSMNLVFCGRVGRRKGAFDLIQAFALLSADQRAFAQLAIAGDGDLDQAQQIAEHFNISDRVSFLGWVSPEQRDQVLSSADIFVLPSYNEGLPMAILEAMAWGLPVITTPVGGIPEVVIPHQNGLLVEPGDVQQLSKAMQLLIEDKALRLSLGKAARKTAESFDARTYGERLADIYELVLKTK
jgi:glycosyltransferase involved in cell wall biosynthesis